MYLRDGRSSPVKAELTMTKKKANLLAAVKRLLAEGLKVTLENACESLKKASHTMEQRIRRYPFHASS